jgi:quercetin dioxygenase-like cupin family protein
MARFLVLMALTCTVACARTGQGDPIATVGENSRVVGSYDITRGSDSVAHVRLVEVAYGPGGSSPSHSHPCPVIGYVVEGGFRSRVGDGPERLHAAGETFYEAPHETHAVSANASPRSFMKLLAIFVCPKP